MARHPRDLRIAPSILSADFSRLGEEVRMVEAAGADQVHVDVMDGHFVPNLSMGPAITSAVRKSTRLPLDVHLMVTRPQPFFEPFVKAGASHITFHIEAEGDPREGIRRLREMKVGVGVALSPDTLVDRVVDLIPLVDMILVMTVHPGFGGQELIQDTLEKIPALRAAEEALLARGIKRQQALAIEVDGGIGSENIQTAVRAGADVFVAGSSIFGADDPPGAVRELRRLLEEVASSRPAAGGRGEKGPSGGPRR